MKFLQGGGLLYKFTCMGIVDIEDLFLQCVFFHELDLLSYPKTSFHMSHTYICWWISRLARDVEMILISHITFIKSNLP